MWLQRIWLDYSQKNNVILQATQQSYVRCYIGLIESRITNSQLEKNTVMLPSQFVLILFTSLRHALEASDWVTSSDVKMWRQTATAAVTQYLSPHLTVYKYE